MLVHDSNPMRLRVLRTVEVGHLSVDLNDAFIRFEGARNDLD